MFTQQVCFLSDGGIPAARDTGQSVIIFQQYYIYVMTRLWYDEYTVYEMYVLIIVLCLLFKTDVGFTCFCTVYIRVITQYI